MSEFQEHRPAPGRTTTSASPDPALSPATAESQGSAPASVPAPAPLGPDAVKPGEEAIVAALKTCYDPEIPVDIYELGLIYAVKIDEGTHAVKVEMTLTSPNCPAAQSLPAEVEQKVKGVPHVTGAQVEVVWEPPWTQDRMSEAAKLALGMY
jgi:FeS assembly SUF system protein